MAAFWTLILQPPSNVVATSMEEIDSISQYCINKQIGSEKFFY
jgi:hypothetical protein